MRSFFLKSTLVLIACALLVGHTFAQTGKKTTISVMHFWTSADAAMKSIATQFEKETGIGVTVYLSAVGTHLNTINLRAQSDDLPQVFTMWPGSSMPPYIASGVVADLGKPVWESRLTSSAKEASRYDGKAYLAPVNLAFLTLAYNSAVLTRLKLKAPQNYAEFEALLAALKKDTAIKSPMIFGSDMLLLLSSIMFATDIYQTMPDFDAKVSSGQKAFNGPEVTKVFQRLLIDWPAKGYYNADTALSTDRMGRAALDFLDGKAGIMPLGSFDIDVLNQINTKKVPVKMIPYPAPGNSGSLIAAAGEAFALSGYDKGETQAAAQKFLEYLMKPENNSKICRAINSLSAQGSVKVEADPVLQTLSPYVGLQASHGWMVWPQDVQNNLRYLSEVLNAPAEQKQAVLKKQLDNLQDIWMKSLSQ